jgi:hypothetical protein
MSGMTQDSQIEIFRAVRSLAVDVISEPRWRARFDDAEDDARAMTPDSETAFVQAGWVCENGLIEQGALIAVDGVGCFDGSSDDEDDEQDAETVTLLYRVDSPRATTYCTTAEIARDKVIAYAMLDELAFTEAVEIPNRLISEEIDGTVEVTR